MSVYCVLITNDRYFYYESYWLSSVSYCLSLVGSYSKRSLKGWDFGGVEGLWVGESGFRLGLLLLFGCDNSWAFNLANSISNYCTFCCR